MAKRPKFPRQVVGNMGLYYVCYRLSRDGWNVMPTSRNAKGPDIVLLNESAEVHHTVQVKSLSKRAALGFGKNRENLRFDFLIACVGLEAGTPSCYVLTKEDVEAKIDAKGKDGQLWLEAKNYATSEYEEKWGRIPTAHS